MTPPSDTQPSADVKYRLDQLTADYVRLSESNAAAIQSLHSVEMRVRTLETAAQSRAITEAREDERDKALYRRLDDLDKDITDLREDVAGIRGLGMKTLGIIGSIVLTAFVGWIMTGGLTK